MYLLDDLHLHYQQPHCPTEDVAHVVADCPLLRHLRLFKDCSGELLTSSVTYAVVVCCCRGDDALLSSELLLTASLILLSSSS